MLISSCAKNYNFPESLIKISKEISFLIHFRLFDDGEHIFEKNDSQF